MKHIEIPQPVTLLLRNGERLRGTVVDASTGQPTAGDIMDPLTFWAYAETWFNHAKMNEGDFRKRQQAAKIIKTFDDAKADNLPVLSLEDADYDRLVPIVNDAVYFTSIVFELQCAPFVEAFHNARSDYPAHLAQPKHKKDKK